jgi:non-specific serine/threonine protein kinase
VPAKADLRLILSGFAMAVTRDAEGRLKAYSAAGTSANAAPLAALREQLTKMRASRDAISAAVDDPVAITAVQALIADAKMFNTTSGAIVIPAARATSARTVPTATPITPGASSSSNAPSPATTSTTASAGSGGATTSATRSEFRRAMREARGLVDQVERLGRRDRPGSNASEAERAGYKLRQANAVSAGRYDDYLDTLEASMRGTSTDSEAKQSINKAYQTRAYLRDLQRQSEQSLK